MPRAAHAWVRPLWTPVCGGGRGGSSGLPHRCERTAKDETLTIAVTGPRPALAPVPAAPHRPKPRNRPTTPPHYSTAPAHATGRPPQLRHILRPTHLQLLPSPPPNPCSSLRSRSLPSTTELPGPSGCSRLRSSRLRSRARGSRSAVPPTPTCRAKALPCRRRHLAASRPRRFRRWLRTPPLRRLMTPSPSRRRRRCKHRWPSTRLRRARNAGARCDYDAAGPARACACDSLCIQTKQLLACSPQSACKCRWCICVCTCRHVRGGACARVLCSVRARRRGSAFAPPEGGMHTVPSCLYG